MAAARALRDEARETYDAAFPDSASVIGAAFRISGHPEWAKTLQPSRQDPGLLVSETNRRRTSRKKDIEPS